MKTVARKKAKSTRQRVLRIGMIGAGGRSLATHYPSLRDLPDVEMPPGGLHYRWPDLPGPQIEERLEAKKAATLAFAGANPIAGRPRVPCRAAKCPRPAQDAPHPARAPRP